MGRGIVAILGSINIDLVTHVARHPKSGETVLGEGLARLPGGKGANQALAVAKAGAAAWLFGHIGCDADGARYLTGLAERGVDISHVGTAAGHTTGLAFVAIDSTGENTIVVVPGANAATTPHYVATANDRLALADVLLMQLEVPLESVMAASSLVCARGGRVILNVSPARPVPELVLALCDPVIVNEHESTLLSAGLPSVCVTMGKHGARWGDLTVPSPSISAIDTTGAGDAFAGMLAAALALGHDRATALRLAVEAGAAACLHDGAQGWSL